VSLEGVCGRLVPLGAGSIAVQFGNDFNFSCSATGIVCVDNFLEAGHAQNAGVGFLEIQNEHFAAVFPERLDHRLAGEFTALEVVGANVSGNFSALCRALGIDGEHRDALGIG